MAPTFPKPAPLALGLLAGMLWPTLGSTDLAIPDSPLFLTSTGVTPNIALTLDDSGSMAWGYIPDGLSNQLARRYAKSPFNPAYYNPETTYRIPPNVAGDPVAATTFGAALVNGFHPGRGTIDLATAYRPTSELNPSSAGAHSYMNHFAVGTVGDPVRPNATWATHFDTGPMIGTNVGATAPYFVVPDFVNADGSAAGHDPGSNIVAVGVEGQAAPAVYDGTFELPCNNTKSPGVTNRYRTNITGGTLTLCFRDIGAMYGKMVSVIHRTDPGPGYIPAGTTDNAAAYYYVFDATNPVDATGALCVPTNETHRTDNDCYDLRIVGQQPGPADLDNDGDIDGDDERQNFANWYSFYRTRNLMTVSAAAFAFQTVPETSRIAWQAINSCRGNASTLVTNTCRGWDATVPNVNNAIRPFTDTQRQNFYNWLFRLPASGWTPTRNALERVGLYYSTSGVGSPYDDDLTDPANNRESTCRRNFHILMTDGVWNTNAEVALTAAYGNADSSARKLPDGIDYDPRHPFSDTNNTSLADIAFTYWAKDLRPDLTNAVPSYVTDFKGEVSDRYFNPKNNPASWQHLVNFNVGLGLTGFLRVTAPPLTWGNDTYAGSYAALAAGDLAWPVTGGNSLPGNVADLWHAALNSRGKFYSAEEPDDLIEAFQDIMDSITTQAASGGGAGLSSNTSQIDKEGALIFEAKFNADWSGQLLARPVSDDLNLAEPLWDAGQRIPAPNERRIFTLNGEPLAIRIEATCPGGPLQAALDKNAVDEADGRCTQRVNWLRGDGRVENADAGWKDGDPLSGLAVLTFEVRDHGYLASDELTVEGVTVSEDPEPAVGFNGAFTVTATTPDSFSVEIAAVELPGTYAGGGRVRYTGLRNRPISVLGDIMSSDPAYVFKDDYGFGGGASAVHGKDEYGDFVAMKELKPPVIYVGANDGMLHAFCANNPDAPPGDPEPACPLGVDPGEELFAYVPQGVYANLSALTDPLYSHRFYVDGPPSISDAFIAGSWGTYLVGSLGAGGKSIFALDVSDPTNFEAEDVKWEFTDADDLGLTFGKPQIAPGKPHQWGVIFGNGYNSSEGTAVLFVVNLATGGRIAKIPTNGATANGLSTPYLYDSDGDSIVDVVYAGDLQGNLWKFVNNGVDWELGNDRDPLFTARNAANQVQPITAPPAVAPHPEGGVLIYFGTGSYLTHCDIGNPDGCDGTYDDQQTFYAIWDKPEATGTLTRTHDLEPYAIIQETTANGFRVRTTSEGTVDWTEDRGWYLDLPATPGAPAERIVSPALVMQFKSASVPDRILFVTNTPSEDPCTMGGTTWLMELDLISGGRPTGPVFDLDGSGTFDERDEVAGQPPSGVALDSSYGITGEPLLLTTEAGNIVKAFSGTTGKSGTDASPLQRGEPPPPVGGNPPARIYWRQVL